MAKKWNRNAAKLALKLDGIIVNHFLNPLGNRLNKAIHDGLDSGKDIQGKSFEPLSEFTINKKAHDQILFDSGKLKDSIKKDPAKLARPTFKIFVEGPAKKYGAKHNEGFVNESGKEVAKREWFGIPKSFKPSGDEHKKAANETRLRLLTTWRKGK